MQWKSFRKNNPLASDLHVDAALSNLVINYMQNDNNFIASKIFPVVPVEKESDKYYIFDKGDLNRRQMKLQGDDDYAPRLGFRVSNDSYYCDYYSGRMPLTRRKQKQSDLELVTPYVNFIGRQGLMERESLFATAMWGTGLWSTEYQGVAASPSTNEFLQFNDSSSTPITIIDQLIEDVRLLSGGFRPNKMVIQPDVWQVMKNHSDYLGRIQYNGANNPAVVTEQLIATIHGLKEVHIAYGVENTAKELLTASMANIMSTKDLWVGYVTDNPSITEPSAGYMFSWDEFDNGDGAVIRRYDDPGLGGGAEWIEGNISTDPKLTGADLGGYLDDAIA